MMWLLWSSWTCQPHSIRWTMTSFCNACRTAPVPPIQSISVRLLWLKPIVYYLSGVWRSAGFSAGTISVCSLHCWPHLTESHGLSPHLYAVGELLASISGCTAAGASWMRSNRLQLNADKTEVLWTVVHDRSPAAQW